MSVATHPQRRHGVVYPMTQAEMNTPTEVSESLPHPFREEDFTESRDSALRTGPEFRPQWVLETAYSSSGVPTGRAIAGIEDASTLVPDEGPSESEKTEALFRRLLRGPDEMSNYVFELLLEDSDPRTILDIALRYDESTAGDRALCLCESLLHRFGDRAWRALEELSRSWASQCLPFVGVIAECPGIDVSDRLRALVNLTNHPSPEVRLEVVEYLDMLPSASRKELLSILMRDRDSDVRDTAIAELDDMG